jgi:DNA helicase-2/ATP-dependent DNA helicase PcrA
MNLTVVGDDDQSIYGWRGAQHDNILAFDRDFPGARMVVLDENYRSTQAILDAANALVEKNRSRKKKRLWTRGAQGDRVRSVACPDPAEEARYVAEEIRALKDRHGYTLGDFAILFRTNVQSRPFEEALRELQVPYIVIGGMAFFDRKEVKDLIAYLRLCISTRDEISLRRVINYPPRGVGLTTLEKLDALAEAENLGLFDAVRRGAAGQLPGINAKAREGLVAFVELIDRYAERFAQGGLGDPATELVVELQLREDIIKSADDVVVGHRKADNVDDLLESMQRYARRRLAERDQAASEPAAASPDEPEENPAMSMLETWLASITLQAADDREKDAEQDRVSLMTLHAAKGLEFKNVFLVGCEEDLLPHSRSLPEGAGGTAATFADDDEADGESGRNRRERLGQLSATQMLEEERRLCYVGMTRARERLYMTHCKLRRKHREEYVRIPSRFLKEVPDELIERIDLDAPPPMNEQEEQAFGAAALAEIWKKLK